LLILFNNCMSGTKSLLKDSVVYGGSNILVKMVSWLMTSLFAYTLVPEEFGMMTNLYAYIGLIMVILTFGMETGFFRFVNQTDKYKPYTVYSTAILIVGSIVALFLVIFMAFLPEIRTFIWEDDIPESYIRIVLLILSIDAFRAIPMAYLRYKKKAKKFAGLNIMNVAIYALLCLFFLKLCPWIYEHNPEAISWFYFPEYKLGYVFISNLIATAVEMSFLIPELMGFRYKFDRALAKEMIKYSFPLVIMGVAGVANQVADKIIFPKVYPYSDGFAQLGIYSACFKIAQIMMMFTQAFRFAYEPFIFEKGKDKDAKQTYSDVMTYFVIFGLFVFLGVTFYIDIIKYFIEPQYFAGLGIVPIVLIGELFFAVYFNLSLWYKLTDKTRWGAIFSIIACLVIIAINIIFIPKYSYWACAWAGLIGNGLIMVLSYFVGQAKYPIRYNLKTVGFYTLLAAVLYAISYFIPIHNTWAHMGFNTLLIGIYLFVVIKRDLPPINIKR